MNIDFSGQVIVVAGGTGGLGSAVSLAFLQEGAKVAVTYRKEEEFLALKALAGSHQVNLEGSTLDVTDESAAQEFIARSLVSAWQAGRLGQHRRRLCWRREAVGHEDERLRPDAGAQSSFWATC